MRATLPTRRTRCPSSRTLTRGCLRCSVVLWGCSLITCFLTQWRLSVARLRHSYGLLLVNSLQKQVGLAFRAKPSTNCPVHLHARTVAAAAPFGLHLCGFRPE